MKAKLRISLPASFEFVIARECAEIVHAAVVGMHLRASFGIWPGDQGNEELYSTARHRDAINDVRALLRSITDRDAKWMMILTIRHIFQCLRKRHGTQVKWQDSVAACKAACAKAQREAR